ncbi:transposase [Lentisphaera marina]|uniref:transposase n=1 Tax=Lentisphaera marina TaxID=1111041 RepID=UPI00236544E8|nr:transposase [Lentisphaera marina]MDD7984864.1 transposase [Lentisphaera marina]
MNLPGLWDTIEKYLFPGLEELLGGELTNKEKEFVRICTITELDQFSHEFEWCGFGRPPKDHFNIVKAYIAKSVYNFDTTRSFIDFLKSSTKIRRLCGWEFAKQLPHESTFSRVFAEITASQLCQRIHEFLVVKHCGDTLVPHISRDSSAIEAREKVMSEPGAEPKAPKKRGRPKKGEIRIKEKTVVEKQVDRSLEENLKELPTHCNKGTKKNSNGYKVSWKGYKLHLDCIDGDIPVAGLLSSASLHDSQAAIPLAQISAQRITNLYDLMDAAYDSPSIHKFSHLLGHKSIIDHNPRKTGEKKIFDPPEKERYKQRSSVERVFSNLKDNYGGRMIRVRGHAKVMTHLMFGIIAITANQLFKTI